MEQNIIKTFQDGTVQACIVANNYNGRVYYRTTFRREYLHKGSGEMRFAYDYDDYHLESLRKVARQSQQWLQSQKANAEVTAGRGHGA